MLRDSTDELLMLRPVGGLDEEITGVLPAVEPVESATFRLRLLRDAARLSTRAAAGPFRSFGRIAVEPRPYQLVSYRVDQPRTRPAPKLDPTGVRRTPTKGFDHLVRVFDPHEG